MIESDRHDTITPRENQEDTTNAVPDVQVVNSGTQPCGRWTSMLRVSVEFVSFADVVGLAVEVYVIRVTAVTFGPRCTWHACEVMTSIGMLGMSVPVHGQVWTRNVK